MRITNFIKNYPCTLFLITLLLVSISIIFIEGKAYALSSSKAKKCNCIPITCPQEVPPEIKNCSLKASGCYCPLGKRSWTHCSMPSVEICTLEEGCSCEDCTPADCNYKCDIKGCENCFTQVVDKDYPCTLPPIDCGDCHIIDP